MDISKSITKGVRIIMIAMVSIFIASTITLAQGARQGTPGMKMAASKVQLKIVLNGGKKPSGGNAYHNNGSWCQQNPERCKQVRRQRWCKQNPGRCGYTHGHNGYNGSNGHGR